MSTNRTRLAMLLVTAALTAASAQAQGTILAPAESFSLLRTDTAQTQLVVVRVTLVPNKWVVTEEDVQKGAKNLWQVDALCHDRVKTLTVGFPGGGQEDYKTELQSKPAHLQKEKSLPSFDPALLRQRCLDVATGSTLSGVGDAEKHNIKEANDKFKIHQWAVTTLDGAQHGSQLSLSGVCSSKDGTKTTSSVSGKKFSTTISLKCCVEESCGQ